MTAWLRGTVLAAGIGLTGYGLCGLLDDPHITAPMGVLVWAMGALILHDGLWLPVVCLVGAFAVRGPVLRGWLIVTASVSAVGLPAVLRAGADRSNPSVLPLPYLRNLLLVIAATGALALLVALVPRWRRRTPKSRDSRGR